MENGSPIRHSAFDQRLQRFPPRPHSRLPLTPEKAMGDLDCKGYTEVLAGDVELISGLTIHRKVSDDPDFYEIAGIPLDDIAAQTDYALALAKICGKVVRVPRQRK